MQDRISKHPNRVQLIPVAGQANVFDLIRVDEPIEVGTPLNKANLLTDDTASLLGLDSTATLDDFLKNVMLGGFKGFWWNKSEIIEQINETIAGDTSSTTATSRDLLSDTVYYSEEVDVYSENGTTYWKLKNPKSIKFTSNSQKLPELHDRYISATTDAVSADNACFYIKPYDSSTTTYQPYMYKNGSTYQIYFYAYDLRTFSITKVKKVLDYVCSSDINAYPNGDYGDDGYYYELDKSVIKDKAIYKWHKYKSKTNYSITELSSNATYDLLNNADSPSKTYDVYVSDNFEAKNGKFYLKAPITKYTVSYNLITTGQVSGISVQNKYLVSTAFQPQASTDENTPYTEIAYSTYNSIGQQNYYGIYRLHISTGKRYQTPTLAIGEQVGYISSFDENAYPDNGFQDDFYYGNRETIKLGGAKIATGSYIGTGAYGASEAVHLIFNFEPKLIFIWEDSGQSRMWALNPSTRSFGYSAGNTGGLAFVSWGANDVSWFSNSASGNANAQNSTGKKYNYVAIG